MKQLKSLVIVVILFIGTQVSAQTKVAHIDVQALMTSMPEMKTAQEQLKKIQETYDKDYKNMVTEYQTKLQKYEQESATAGDALNETRSKEVQDMQKRIVDYRDNAQKELQQKESDIVKPIMDKVKASIQKVGKAKGYQYVINASDLLLADGPDLTADVKKDLGF